MAASRDPAGGTGFERPRTRGGAGMLAVALAALLGLVLARAIDWRSHAHPR
jgi:hypothetical protein